MEKSILKFIRNCRRARIAKTILKKRKDNSHLPISKLTTKLHQSVKYNTGIKIHADQGNGIKSPEINPYSS